MRPVDDLLSSGLGIDTSLASRPLIAGAALLFMTATGPGHASVGILDSYSVAGSLSGPTSLPRAPAFNVGVVLSEPTTLSQTAFSQIPAFSVPAVSGELGVLPERRVAVWEGVMLLLGLEGFITLSAAAFYVFWSSITSGAPAIPLHPYLALFAAVCGLGLALTTTVALRNAIRA